MFLQRLAGGRVVSARLDADAVRRDFPILSTEVHGKPLVFLDSAASAQKPRQVIDAMTRLYETGYANIHRGVYHLSQVSTHAFEDARGKAARFLGAADAREVVFTRNATEGINLWRRAGGVRGSRPATRCSSPRWSTTPTSCRGRCWCEQTGATLRVAPIDDLGVLRVEEFERLLSPRTRIAAFTHVSNALGTINPVKELVAMAHEHGAVVLVDGAQAAPHLAVDVRDLGADFYVFTAHKLFGPSGVGVLYGRLAHLESMPPYQGGGGHDRDGDLREDHLRRRAPQVRGGNAEHRGHRRPGRGHRLRGCWTWTSRRCRRARGRAAGPYATERARGRDRRPAR